MRAMPSLTLAGRFAAAAGKQGLDRLGLGAGRSLPDRSVELLEPRRLNHLLQEHGTGRLPAEARVLDVERLERTCPSSNCSNLVLRLEWDRQDERLPTQIFAKLPGVPFLTRAFCNLVGAWDMECRFCRYVAPEVPIRTPDVYAVARLGSRFALLLEDLCQDPAVALFSNRDMARGTDLEVARGCLETLARLHGHFSHRSREEQERLIPSTLHPFLSPRGRQLSVALNAAAIEPCRRRAPDLFTADLAHVCRSVLEVFEGVSRAWYDRARTVVHGDSHLGNFFRAGDRMGMLDFQAAQWSPGIRDVQYFLIASLEPDLLGPHEEDLVRHYTSAISQAGAPLGFDEAWDAYRGFSVQTLQTMVVSLGLGGLTERDEVVHTTLRRAAAAVERLDFRAWLQRSVRGAG